MNLTSVSIMYRRKIVCAFAENLQFFVEDGFLTNELLHPDVFFSTRRTVLFDVVPNNLSL